MVSDKLWGLFADVKIDHVHSLLWHFETMQHHVVNVQINYYTYACTSCEIFVKIVAVTSEFKRAKMKICRDSAGI